MCANICAACAVHAAWMPAHADWDTVSAVWALLAMHCPAQSTSSQCLHCNEQVCASIPPPCFQARGLDPAVRLLACSACASGVNGKDQLASRPLSAYLPHVTGSALVHCVLLLTVMHCPASNHPAFHYKCCIVCLLAASCQYASLLSGSHLQFHTERPPDPPLTLEEAAPIPRGRCNMWFHRRCASGSSGPTVHVCT